MNIVIPSRVEYIYMDMHYGINVNKYHLIATKQHQKQRTLNKLHLPIVPLYIHVPKN